MADVVAIGELLVDFSNSPSSVGQPGRILGDAGGAPANVLCSVARLGAQARFIGKVGRDPFGAFLRRTLEEVGIDTTYLYDTEDAMTTLAFVTLDESGERSFTFMRNPGADLLLNITELDPRAWQGAKVFHFGSLSLTAEPSLSATLGAVMKAKQDGLVISYDPNWRPHLWESEIVGIRGMKIPLPLADIIKVSLEEMRLLTNTKDVEKGTKKLIAEGAELVVVTLGDTGCYYRTKAGLHGHVATKRTTTVDATGAGDAFLGTLLYQLCQQNQRPGEIPEPLLRVFLRAANSAGALTASRPGTFAAFPTWKEIIDYL